ncbi:hypothetical protein MM236_12360 [Belliella sp. DSM 107340]|uniref:Uncharacterized protein n=2 Tax=Belliella calami TaxID=2923436 RepID=A0ABS9UQI7_9BACT|nr:hypothetical protein [Belliella calami]
MIRDNLAKRRKERKRWALVFLVCLATVLFFSYEPSEHNFLHTLINPIEFLKVEQENQFYQFITKFFSFEIPEKFKRLYLDS